MKGFSLLEVLVSLLVLTIGMLTIAQLQLISLHNVNAAYQRGVAIIQIANMMERLRVNKSSTRREAELAQWNIENSELLTNAVGDFSCDIRQCQVSLHWHDGEMTISSAIHG